MRERDAGQRRRGFLGDALIGGLGLGQRSFTIDREKRVQRSIRGIDPVKESARKLNAGKASGEQSAR